MSTGRPPVIVIGMHRSGTGALTGSLEMAGLFVGHRKDKNHEPLLFKELNEWLLRQSGASWDHPEPVDLLVEDAEVRGLCGEYLRQVLGSPRALSFLGWKRFMRYRRVDRIDVPWGWKDPRSTFTLPIWLDLFPDARVIHVVRHGVDVAASLRSRRVRDLARRRKKFRRNQPVYMVWPKRTGFTDTLRGATLEGALSLWDGYVTRGRAHVSAMGDRATEVRYEDLVADPERVIRELTAFCGLPADGPATLAAAATVRRRRADGSPRPEEVEEFERRHTRLLRAHGY